jgi:hypothetical protein
MYPKYSQGFASIVFILYCTNLMFGSLFSHWNINETIHGPLRLQEWGHRLCTSSQNQICANGLNSKPRTSIIQLLMWCMKYFLNIEPRPITKCPGRIVDTVGRDFSVFKSNRQHVVIFCFFLDLFGYIL